MKKFLFSISTFVLLVIVSSSCSKETVTKTVTNYDTTVVVDTVPPSLLTKIQLITSHTWEVEQSYYSLGGTVYSYFRSGSNNTFPAPGIDATRYTFAVDSTGTYTDGYGHVTGTTWNFTTPADTSLIINFNSQTDDWTLLTVSDTALFTTTFVPSQDLVSAVKLIPVP